MSSLGSLEYLVMALGSQLPVAIVSLIGLGLAWSRRKTSSRGLGWAMAGFGLAFALCIVSPLSLVLFQWMMTAVGSSGASSHMTVYMLFSIFWSLLGALPYLMLGIAVFIGHAPAANQSSSG